MYHWSIIILPYTSDEYGSSMLCKNVVFASGSNLVNMERQRSTLPCLRVTLEMAGVGDHGCRSQLFRDHGTSCIQLGPQYGHPLVCRKTQEEACECFSLSSKPAFACPRWASCVPPASRAKDQNPGGRTPLSGLVGGWQPKRGDCTS